MKMIMNPAIARMASEIGCDYLFALGLFMALREMEKSKKSDRKFDERTVYQLGYMSTKMSRMLSTELSTKIWDIYRDITVDIKRDMERDKKRDYRQRKRNAPFSPFSPTPPIPPISPKEKEIGNAPLSLRDRPPEGANTPKKRFSAPTVDEVKAYAEEKGFTGFEADRFVDFYASKGWMVGKSPMKDWKAAVRNWKRGSASGNGGRAKEWHNPTLDYKQREYKDEDFGDNFFIDLDKYGEGK